MINIFSNPQHPVDSGWSAINVPINLGQLRHFLGKLTCIKDLFHDNCLWVLEELQANE